MSRPDLLAAVEDLKTGSGRLTASLLGAERPVESDLYEDTDDGDSIGEADW